MENKTPTHISFFSASLSGAIHIFIGYPFDTIKTLQQGKMHNTYKCLNIFNIYRGIKYPLIQNSIVNGSIFSINNYFKNNTTNRHIGNFYTALLSTFILTPFDKYKVMSQYNKKYKLNLKNIISTYKNYPIICMTEIPATFTYFSVYHKLKSDNYPSFFSGSMAGLTSWLCIYPLDTIKVRIQSETCKNIKQAYQMGNLFKGIYVCIIRSMLVNGVNFYCYENIQKFLLNKL